MLIDLGYGVDENDLHPSPERKSRFNDVHAWSGTIYKDGEPVEIFSWDTMTLCAKNGITINRETLNDGYGLEVYASK